MYNWAVLSDEQMSNGWSFSLLNDEQMSNKVGVEHQPDKVLSTPWKINMEPKNHRIEKDNYLPSTSIFGFHRDFPGCVSSQVKLVAGTFYPQYARSWNHLGGGFNHFILSPLFGEDSLFDDHIFQMGWFNHQLVIEFQYVPCDFLWFFFRAQKKHTERLKKKTPTNRDSKQVYGR